MDAAEVTGIRKVILGAMMRARAGPRVAGVAVREIAGPCSTTLLHPLLRPLFLVQ
jgi:hypothetical protein